MKTRLKAALISAKLIVALLTVPLNAQVPSLKFDVEELGFGYCMEQENDSDLCVLLCLDGSVKVIEYEL